MVSPRKSEPKNEMTIERYHSDQTQIQWNNIKGTSGTLKRYQTSTIKCNNYFGYDFHYDFHYDYHYDYHYDNHYDYYNNYYNYYYNDYNNDEVGVV